MAIASKKSIEKYEKEQNALHRGAKKAYQVLAENIVLIGKCGKCKGDLIYYAQSEPQNLWNYYCIGDGDKKICTEKFIRDTRRPFGTDYFFDGQNPITIVMQIQKDVNEYIIEEEQMDQPSAEGVSFDS